MHAHANQFKKRFTYLDGGRNVLIDDFDIDIPVPAREIEAEVLAEPEPESEEEFEDAQDEPQQAEEKITVKPKVPVEPLRRRTRVGIPPQRYSP